MRISIILAAAAGLAAGCATVDPHPGSGPKAYSSGKGPPAHAPAHGYRRKQAESRLVFEPEIGVYVVIDLPGYYYDGDSYFRRHRGRWQAALGLDGPWLEIAARDLPPGLVKHQPPGSR